MKIHIKQVYETTVTDELSLLDVMNICKGFAVDNEECFLCNDGGALKIRRVIG